MHNSSKPPPLRRLSVPARPTSVNEFCLVCGNVRPELSCACGGKFHLICIGDHVQQINFESEFIQNKIGERLTHLEQIVQDRTCQHARTTVENWKRKRLQEIHDIADDVLHRITQRESAPTEVGSLRTEYDELCQGSEHVVHQKLDSLVDLQGRVRDISDQLNVLPELFAYDHVDLDRALQAKLNPASVCLNSSEGEMGSSVMTNGDSEIHSKIESTVDLLTDATPPITTEPTFDPLMKSKKIPPAAFQFVPAKDVIPEPKSEPIEDSLVNTEQSASISTNVSVVESPANSEPLFFAPVVSLEESVTSNIESPIQTNPPPPVNNTNSEEFDSGETDRIIRRNITRIPTTDDKYVATIACHGNELFYNDLNSQTGKARLTLIRDFARPMEKEIIRWPEPEAVVGGGDDDWVQDIAYCDSLKGYLLLNRSRLRFLSDSTHQIDEFHPFPDRSMKRVTCNNSFIYLIIAGGMTSPHGDEILLMNYQKEERIVKTFRDIVHRRTMRPTMTFVGEISDIAVNNAGQLIFSYRCERQQEVGVCIYNITSDGLNWSSIKSLMLNECWHSDLSHTPRIEWCEKLNCFILVEFLTSHLILLDCTGQVKGERLFLSGDHGGDSPLNLSISSEDCLAIRYKSFINLHRLA